MTSYIKSIQQVSITIASGSTTNTASIASVDLTKSVILYQGLTASSTSALQGVVSRVELTNATTVTATRGASNSDTVTVCAVVVEFASDVNSIQAGTINVNGALSATATISAVGANAFVIWLGQSSATAQSSLSRITTAVALTNSTTVTAFAGTANSNMTVGYMVVDLTSNIVNSVQKLAHTDTSNTASYTDSITSVTAANTILLNNGDILAGGLSGTNFEATRELTNATTVTYTIGGGSSVSKTHYSTVLEFKGVALNSAVKRGTNTITSATSHAATISSVNTAFAFCNFGGFRFTGVGPNVSFPTQALTNSTTVTSALNSSGGAVTSYEVVEFIAPTGVGTSTGSTTAQATGASAANSTASSAGIGAVTGGGSSAASATANANGAGTVSGGGQSTAQAMGSSVGSSTVQASGTSLTMATGSASSTSVAGGSGRAIAAGTAASGGIATAQAPGVAQATAAGTSAGTATAQASGPLATFATAMGSGSSAASGVGAASRSAVAISIGAGSASASGIAGISASGSSTGNSEGIAISAALAQAIVASMGSSFAIGHGTSITRAVNVQSPASRTIAANQGNGNIAADARHTIINADSANRII